ncbi:MAG: four helix bundle protein [Lewinellaceae bacterium]|nr:four helix bundle protein [Lewinellaceae bacterium]
MKHEEFNEGFRERTKKFAVEVINYCGKLPSTPSVKVILYQLCKSSTSVGANFRAFCRGRSKNEKYAKICIMVEEADESLYWLELISDSGKDASEKLLWLTQESTEILKIVAKIKSAFEPSPLSPSHISHTSHPCISSPWPNPNSPRRV